MRMADIRLVVFASENDKGDRYFNRTLDEIDKVSLVRDRTGDALAEDSEEEDDDNHENGNDEPEVLEPPRADEELDKQDAKAEAWGLDLGPRPSSSFAAPSNDDDEDETDNEKAHSEEEYSDDEPPRELSPTLQAPESLSPTPGDRLLPVLTEPNVRIFVPPDHRTRQWHQARMPMTKKRSSPIWCSILTRLRMLMQTALRRPHPPRPLPPGSFRTHS